MATYNPPQLVATIDNLDQESGALQLRVTSEGDLEVTAKDLSLCDTVTFTYNDIETINKILTFYLHNEELPESEDDYDG